MADKRSEKRRTRNRSSSLERKRNRSRSCSEDEDGKKEKKSEKNHKRKSRKRSYSDSEYSTSSPSSSSECDNKRLEKKAKKKKKRRSSTSASSSSESDDKHSNSKSINKHHKRKLKKEKKMKKKKKKDKKAKKHGAVDQNKYGAYGIIRESDMFVKQQEFYCWLQEVKNTNAETLPKFEMRTMFETFMEDYNTATLPLKKYYDLEKWEAKRQHKNELKALKKARESSFSIADDEKRHDMLHRRVTSNKHAGPSRQQLLEMQQELRRRQDEEYRKKAGLS